VLHELHEIYLGKAFYLDLNAPNQAKILEKKFAISYFRQDPSPTSFGGFMSQTTLINAIYEHNKQEMHNFATFLPALYRSQTGG